MIPDRSKRIVVVLCAVAGLLLLASLANVLVAAVRGPTPLQTASNGGATRDFTTTSPIRLSDFETFDGPDYGSRGHSATADDGQTKLWFAEGSWWGVLEKSPTDGTHIFRWTGRRWSDTGVLVDERPLALADVVWTGEHLYVASRPHRGALTLRRFYLSAAGSWVPQDFVPTTISAGDASTLSIAVDSKDRIWAVYNRGNRVWLTHSTHHGRGFARATPVSAREGVRPDDTSAVVAVRGHIAVLWSDQVSGAFRFAIRRDSAPPSHLRITPPPVQGIRIADGHIHLLATSDGRILAAVKTSLGDATVDPPRSPLLVLLERSPQGSWTQHTVATTADQMTRPEIVLSRDERTLFLFATSPQTGGAVYVKVADTDSLLFAPGKGTRIIQADAHVFNNVTVARKRVSPRTGLLVLASDADNARYYTSFIPLASSSAGSAR